jgi:hypothetical protein
MPEKQQPRALPRRRPGAGAIRFADLVGRLDVVRVTCTRCDRAGRYSLAQLIERHGAEVGLPDWMAALTADCPLRPRYGTIWNQCGAHCPDLPAAMCAR